MGKHEISVVSYVTPELLFLCWRNLIVRKNKSSFSRINENNFFEPLSKNWFKKTSDLINSGDFDYKIFRKKLYFYNPQACKKILNSVKCLVVQSAFIFVLRFHFSNYFLDCYNFCGIGILV